MPPLAFRGGGPLRRAIIMLVILSLAGEATALAANADGYRAPRTPDGAPDLQGLWSNASLTQLERPDELKRLAPTDAETKAYETAHVGKPPTDPEDTVGGAQSEWWDWDEGLARIRGQVRSSWIVSPADGKVPYTAAAKAFHKARHMRRKVDFDNPEGRSQDERCLSTDAIGPPLQNGGYNDNFQFVQTRDRLAIMAEYMHDVRIVRLGAAGHPPPSLRQRMGDSIGRWEGETLMIETTNFTPEEVDDPKGDPAADMKVVERITRISPKALYYEFSVSSPAVYIQTWKGEMVFHPTKGAIYEFACHEGNYAMEGMLRGGQRQSAAEAPAIPAAAPAKPAGQ